jgi:hypothetical protein
LPSLAQEVRQTSGPGLALWWRSARLLQLPRSRPPARAYIYKQQWVGHKLVSKFYHTNIKSLGEICDFPINFTIKPTKVLSHKCTQINHKTPRVVLPGLNKSKTSYWSHMHTCWSNKNKHINYGISIHQKQDKCI